MCVNNLCFKRNTTNVMSCHTLPWIWFLDVLADVQKPNPGKSMIWRVTREANNRAQWFVHWGSPTGHLVIRRIQKLKLPRTLISLWNPPNPNPVASSMQKSASMVQTLVHLLFVISIHHSLNCHVIHGKTEPKNVAYNNKRRCTERTRGVSYASQSFKRTWRVTPET